ncbi:hypothetical protein HK102_013598 [Quaeritorhiza haematococci]|nr:hypothetical protein HK102_013598 [Quaeritorhiza haematococci]
MSSLHATFFVNQPHPHLHKALPHRPHHIQEENLPHQLFGEQRQSRTPSTASSRRSSSSSVSTGSSIYSRSEETDETTSLQPDISSETEKSAENVFRATPTLTPPMSPIIEAEHEHSPEADAPSNFLTLKSIETPSSEETASPTISELPESATIQQPSTPSETPSIFVSEFASLDAPSETPSHEDIPVSPSSASHQQHPVAETVELEGGVEVGTRDDRLEDVETSAKTVLETTETQPAIQPVPREAISLETFTETQQQDSTSISQDMQETDGTQALEGGHSSADDVDLSPNTSSEQSAPTSVDNNTDVDAEVDMAEVPNPEGVAGEINKEEKAAEQSRADDGAAAVSTIAETAPSTESSMEAPAVVAEAAETATDTKADLSSSPVTTKTTTTKVEASLFWALHGHDDELGINSVEKCWLDSMSFTPHHTEIQPHDDDAEYVRAWISWTVTTVFGKRLFVPWDSLDDEVGAVAWAWTVWAKEREERERRERWMLGKSLEDKRISYRGKRRTASSRPESRPTIEDILNGTAETTLVQSTNRNRDSTMSRTRRLRMRHVSYDSAVGAEALLNEGDEEWLELMEEPDAYKDLHFIVSPLWIHEASKKPVISAARRVSSIPTTTTNNTAVMSATQVDALAKSENGADVSVDSIPHAAEEDVSPTTPEDPAIASVPVPTSSTLTEAGAQDAPPTPPHPSDADPTQPEPEPRKSSRYHRRLSKLHLESLQTTLSEIHTFKKERSEQEKRYSAQSRLSSSESSSLSPSGSGDDRSSLHGSLHRQSVHRMFIPNEIVVGGGAWSGVVSTASPVLRDDGQGSFDSSDVDTITSASEESGSLDGMSLQGEQGGAVGRRNTRRVSVLTVNHLLQELDGCILQLEKDAHELDVLQEVILEEEEEEEVIVDRKGARSAVDVMDDDLMLDAEKGPVRKRSTNAKALKMLGIVPPSAETVPGRQQASGNWDEGTDDSMQDEMAMRRRTTNLKALKLMGVTEEELMRGGGAGVHVDEDRQKELEEKTKRKKSMMGGMSGGTAGVDNPRPSGEFAAAASGAADPSTETPVTTGPPPTVHTFVEDPSLVSGYLSKFSSNSMLRRWKRRFFILSPGRLYYFKSNERNERALGSIPINHMTDVYVSGNPVFKGKYVLEIRSDSASNASTGNNASNNTTAQQTGSKGGAPESDTEQSQPQGPHRSWYLLCEDQEDLLMWLRGIKSAIVREKFSQASLPPPPPPPAGALASPVSAGPSPPLPQQPVPQSSPISSNSTTGSNRMTMVQPVHLRQTPPPTPPLSSPSTHMEQGMKTPSPTPAMNPVPPPRWGSLPLPGSPPPTPAPQIPLPTPPSGRPAARPQSMTPQQRVVGPPARISTSMQGYGPRGPVSPLRSQTVYATSVSSSSSSSASTISSFAGPGTPQRGASVGPRMQGVHEHGWIDGAGMMNNNPNPYMSSSPPSIAGRNMPIYPNNSITGLHFGSPTASPILSPTDRRPSVSSMSSSLSSGSGPSSPIHPHHPQLYQHPQAYHPAYPYPQPQQHPHHPPHAMPSNAKALKVMGIDGMPPQHQHQRPLPPPLTSLPPHPPPSMRSSTPPLSPTLGGPQTPPLAMNAKALKVMGLTEAEVGGRFSFGGPSSPPQPLSPMGSPPTGSPSAKALKLMGLTEADVVGMGNTFGGPPPSPSMQYPSTPTGSNAKALKMMGLTEADVAGVGSFPGPSSPPTPTSFNAKALKIMGLTEAEVMGSGLPPVATQANAKALKMMGVIDSDLRRSQMTITSHHGGQQPAATPPPSLSSSSASSSSPSPPSLSSISTSNTSLASVSSQAQVQGYPSPPHRTSMVSAQSPIDSAIAMLDLMENQEKRRSQSFWP